MKILNYIWFWGLIFPLILSVTCCTKGSLLNREDSGIIPQENRADYVTRDVVHYSYEHGVLKLKIDFEHGEYYSGQGELLVENCSFVYYDNNGETVSRGSSKRAKLMEGKSILIAEGNVEVVSEINRGKLNTQYLEWHGQEDQFVTPSFVTFTRENGDKLSGTGMIADIGLQVITINRDVRGVIESFEE